MKYNNPRCIICRICKLSTKWPTVFLIFYFLIVENVLEFLPDYRHMLIFLDFPDTVSSVLVGIGSVLRLFLFLLAFNALTALVGVKFGLISGLMKFICKEDGYGW